MQVRHVDSKLERLEADASFRGGYDHKIVKAFRKTMAVIRGAFDERTFYALKGLHYEKLKGDRSHERSMRLNDQFRLILQVLDENGTTVVIVSIEDYH
jgi:proteic killer suppression protein